MEKIRYARKKCCQRNVLIPGSDGCIPVSMNIEPVNKIMIVNILKLSRTYHSKFDEEVLCLFPSIVHPTPNTE